MTRRVFLLTLLIAGISGLGLATERAHQISADDYFTIAGITGLALSPDGARAAWTEQRWDEDEDGRTAEIWSVDLQSLEPTRLTFDAVGASGLQYGPTGQWLYFAAPDCDGASQVWRMHADGSKRHAITKVKDGVDLWDLSENGSMLVFTLSVDRTGDEWKDLRDRYSDLEYGHGVTGYSEVRVLDLRTWRTRTVFDGDRVISDLDVAGDGTIVALVTTPDNEAVHNEGWSRVDVLDVESGELSVVTNDGWRQNHSSPYGWVDSISMTDDGDALAFTVSFDGFPTQMIVAHLSGETWTLADLNRPAGVSVVGGSARWRAGGHNLVFEGDVDAAVHLYEITSPGSNDGVAASALTTGDATISRWATDTSGKTMLVVSGALDSADDLYAIQADGTLRRVTTINPQMDSWILPTIQRIAWKAPDGRTVSGILELPPGWTPEDGPLPTVIEIHGGPTSATRYQMRFWIYGRTLLAAKGYALLSPNYRGSTGYGDDFMTELIGRENDIEVKDILAGVDMLVDKGIADPERLGTMGWSNGGFLTNALITQTDRFKVASSGAGVLDQVMQWAIEDTPGHVVNFMSNALPWENPEHFIKGSPLYQMDKVKTPTLIHVGGNDPRVPPAHSRGLYRALAIYLGVPTELVVYPGAHHGLRTFTHREAKMAWDLAWIEKYLGQGWSANL